MLADIKRAVKDKAEKAGLDLVLNAGESLTGIPEVLFARPEYDFSDEIIEVLNRARPGV